LEAAKFHTGADIDDTALACLQDAYVNAGDGFLWLKDFLTNQGNWPLRANAPAHKGIARCLLKHNDFTGSVISYLNEKTTECVTIDIILSIGKGNGKGKGNSKGKREEFETFWKAYPRKIGKKKAYTAWQTVNPTLELAQKIYAAVEQQVKCEQWLKDGGQFIPHPTTWLNQGRWDDEVVEGSIKKTTAEKLAEYNKLVASYE